MTRKRISMAVVIMLLCCLTSLAGFAQTATGRIVGTVQDTTGAVVPNATVTATNESTNVSFKVSSNSAGLYNFEALQPGGYTISVEAGGVKKYFTTPNVLSPNHTRAINIHLQTSAISEVVQVQGSYEKVQTNQSGNIGNIVNQKTLISLPLSGRNPLDLVLIQPGVVSGANTGGGVHIFGARDRAINITLDGIDANE